MRLETSLAGTDCNVSAKILNSDGDTFKFVYVIIDNPGAVMTLSLTQKTAENLRVALNNLPISV